MRKCSRPVHRALSELNVTPLLDLGFVLLVIFLITTSPVVQDRALGLPQAAPASHDAPPLAHTLTLDADGRLFLDREVITFAELAPRLATLRAAEPALPVVVRGDARLRYREILRVMDSLQQARITRVELATETRRPANP